MKKKLHILGILIFFYIQQFQLSYSATVGLKNNLTIALPWVLLNMLIVSLPFMIELLIIKRIKWVVLVNIILITILSIINYHILLFHGSPFLAGDIFSIPTALNVVSEYTVVLDSIVNRLLGLFGIELFGWYFLYQKIGKKNFSKQCIKRRFATLLMILNFGCYYFIL